MGRVLVVVLLAALSSAFSQLSFRLGLRQVGSLEQYAPREVLAFFAHALSNGYVIRGTAFAAVSYFCYLVALSWKELTVVLPMAAIEYAFTAGLAVGVLKEHVPPLRWVGIGFVVLGVTLVARSGEAP